MVSGGFLYTMLTMNLVMNRFIEKIIQSQIIHKTEKKKKKKSYIIKIPYLFFIFY